jgi:hypothetical protein
MQFVELNTLTTSIAAMDARVECHGRDPTNGYA